MQSRMNLALSLWIAASRPCKPPADGLGRRSEAFSICFDLSRVSQGLGDHIDVQNLHQILVRTVIFLPVRLARMAL